MRVSEEKSAQICLNKYFNGPGQIF